MTPYIQARSGNRHGHLYIHLPKLKSVPGTILQRLHTMPPLDLIGLAPVLARLGHTIGDGRSVFSEELHELAGDLIHLVRQTIQFCWVHRRLGLFP